MQLKAEKAIAEKPLEMVAKFFYSKVQRKPCFGFSTNTVPIDLALSVSYCPNRLGDWDT
ncbi:hypothetical protein [Argonema antarcticum]|uniref:hypothetical protein n=1 Tax=Argonema antarcticum TaxID=2942763 RepID=UPI00201240B1|nr:hypothetical protein [Argonema antarcticum]